MGKEFTLMSATHKKRLICMLIITFFLMTGTVFPRQAVPAQPEEKSPVQKWMEDIDTLAAELPQKHKNLYFRLSESAFKQKIQALKDCLPGLSDEEIIWRLSRIIASVGDSHTTLRYQTKIAFPFSLYWFKNGIYVINTVPEYKHILYRRLVGVNGKPMGEVLEILKQGIPHENHAQVKNYFPYYLTMAEYLYGARLIEDKDKARFTFVDKDGAAFEAAMTAVSLKTKPEWVVTGTGEGELPLYRRNRDKYYSFTYLDDQKTVYVLYNSCRMMKDKLFKDFVKEVFEHADKYPVEKFVVDLRNNGGGNSIIFYPLLKRLKEHEKLNQTDKLFVIVGRRTFSSAVLNALQMKNRTNATFAGEPSGGKPNHFGEIKYFKLPNSGLFVSYSTKYFSYSEEDTDAIYPDIPVELTIEDYLNNRDPVLEKILKH